jgi:AcrR family transcriptional regulator
VPKIVDAERRRDEVLEATWRVMARVGIESVSVREIAAEAGYSTGVIAHYFKNKDDVIDSALLRVWRREADRIADGTAGLRGMEALRATVAEVLPSGEERKLEMAVWLCFWGRAIGDDRLIAEQCRYYGTWRALLRRHLMEAQKLGEVRAELDPAAEAVRLAAIIDGVGIQAVFESERFADRKLPQIVEAHLRSLQADNTVTPPANRPQRGTRRRTPARRQAEPPARRQAAPPALRQAEPPASASQRRES